MNNDASFYDMVLEYHLPAFSHSVLNLTYVLLVKFFVIVVARADYIKSPVVALMLYSSRIILENIKACASALARHLVILLSMDRGTKNLEACHKSCLLTHLRFRSFIRVQLTFLDNMHLFRAPARSVEVCVEDTLESEAIYAA